MSMAPLPIDERPPCKKCGAAGPTSEGRKNRLAWLWRCKGCGYRYTSKIKSGVEIEPLKPKEPELLKWMKRVVKNKVDDNEPQHIQNLRVLYLDNPQKFIDRMSKMESEHSRSMIQREQNGRTQRPSEAGKRDEFLPPARKERASEPVVVAQPDEGQERVEELIERLLVEVRVKMQGAA